VREQAAYLWMLFGSGAANGIGQVTMRWGGRNAKVPFSTEHFIEWASSSRWWLLGLLLTWTSGLAWAVLLRSVRLVIALPLFAGTAYLLTLLGAIVLLGERPSVLQVAGILCVMVGIVLIVARP
jgi:multidrug transporter EmrE-like cation transporter